MRLWRNAGTSSNRTLRRHFSEEARRRFLQLHSSKDRPEVPPPSTTIAKMTTNPLPKLKSEKAETPSSAVIIPLVAMREEGDSIIFTKRSMLLKAHRGEVCFPGGRADHQETVEQAATRELEEEIGIPRNLIDVWGRLPPIPTRVRGMSVTPIVGEIKEADLASVSANFDEVDAVFTAPIEQLIASTEFTMFCDKKRLYTMPIFRIKKFKVLASFPSSFVPKMEEIRLWGLSSIMLHFFLTHMYPDRYSNKCFQFPTPQR